MNPPNNSAQQARTWSSNLGTLAAEQPAITPIRLGEGDTRLAAIVQHIRQRHQSREHAHDKLRAQEFVMGH
jgi:hypothetical protein